MTQSEITLCLIVRDEVEYLAECLEATQGICADIVVVDTGSTDGTLEIARSYTSRVHEISMGDDFSAPRNAALDLVETAWALFLDADERFTASELARIPEVLAGTDADVQALRVLRYNFFATGGFFTNRVVKLMRNLPHVRYRRRVSESVRGSVVEAGGRVVDAPLVLNHFGHTRSATTRAAKGRRYVDLMSEHLVEHPREAGIIGNKAMVLLSLGLVGEALATAEDALSIDPGSASLHAVRGHMLRAAGRPEEALDAYRTACDLDPADAGARTMLGVMHLALGRLDEAEDTLLQAESLDPVIQHARLNRGLVRQARADHVGAVELFRSVAERNPGFLVDVWRGRTEVDASGDLLNETLVRFAGLGYHLAYCELRSRR